MPNARVDPFPRYNFLVEIDGISRAGFMTCSGLEEETEVRTYREGGDQSTQNSQDDSPSAGGSGSVDKGGTPVSCGEVEDAPSI